MKDIDKLKAAIELLADVACNNIKDDPSPELVTPPGVKFALYSTGDIAGLLFNDYKQRLVYHRAPYGVYGVEPCSLVISTFRIAEGLSLTPCQFKDLKPGEFYTDESEHYYLRLAGKEYVIPRPDGSVEVYLQVRSDYKVWRVGE